MFNATTLEQIIKNTRLFKDYIGVPYITNSEAFDDENKLRGYLEELINEQEIIYNHTAIKFLAENDASLIASLEIASDLGYETKNLNSELLATLLLQQKLGEELAELDLDSCFEEE